MMRSRKHIPVWSALLASVLLIFILSACNLSGSPEQQEIIQTETLSVTLLPSRTPVSTSGLPATALFPTLLPGITFPTAIVSIPTSVPPVVFPVASSLPLNISVVSPLPGNVVAGNVQILGSASHPQFLQYQLEYGPDPNPGNLWFPATNPVSTPILNGLLGIWSTNTVQDARYQLRLRVYLRDGRIEQTVISNITVQNRVNTPVPSPTLDIPRPVAAFTQDVVTGQVPLTVRFTNQSTGGVNTVSWTFGDGTSSSEVNPTHIYGSPGLYTVTLTVTGVGGTSNVSRQISANSPSAPVAGFTQDRAGGIAPVSIQFLDQSTGTVSNYLWNFSDGTTSAERNPQHVFTTPGIYNVILNVSGPGGSSNVIRQISVSSTIPPTSTQPTQTVVPSATTIPFTATIVPSTTTVPFTATTIPSVTVEPVTVTTAPSVTSIPPTLTETPTITLVPPTLTETPTITLVPPTLTETPTITIEPPTVTPTETAVPEPIASYTFVVSQDNPLAVQFMNASTGTIVSVLWSFNDGTGMTSGEQNPLYTFPAAGIYTVMLTVTDSLGRQSTYEAQVSVSAPLVASFTTTVNGLTAIFTNQSTGTITSYLWDFGDGTSSIEASPTHLYTASNSYLVTLTISDANGRTNSTNQTIAVTQPIDALFTFEVVADVAQSIQFTDQSTGAVSVYTWDFGDGQQSNEVSPLHAYSVPGTYTVTLTISDANGATDTFSAVVDVIAAPAPTPSIVDLAPIIPNASEAGNAYQNGTTQGNRASVFAVAGDAIFAQPEILRVFAPGSSYLLGNYGYLQAQIDWFNQTDLGGNTSFTQASQANRADWTLQSLVDPSQADTTVCLAGETPLDCELRLSLPVVVFISTGFNDVRQFTDVGVFENTLRQVVNIALSHGVIPVLLTVPPDSASAPETTLIYNEIIVRVSDETEALLINSWRLLSTLPNQGQGNFGLSVAPNGSGDLSEEAINGFGANALNRALLQTLNDVRSAIFPNAIP